MTKEIIELGNDVKKIFKKEDIKTDNYTIGNIISILDKSLPNEYK